MNTIFMNSENGKTSAILLNRTDKRKLKSSDRYVALSNLSIYYAWKKYENVIQK